MKKFFLASSAAAMAAFGLIACGDEVTNISGQEGIPQIAAGESLGKCSDKNVGEMFFVTDSSAVYYCADGKWKSLNGRDGDKGDKGESGSSSVDTLVMNNVDTVYVRDTVILNNNDTPAKLDTIVLDNRDTIVSYDTLVSKDTVYVYDTTVVKYEPEYDTVTTAYLNQEMLADGKYGILVDKRDNKVYRTVEIGQQTWMAQNLDYSDGGITSYCYNNSLDSCAKYGRLYSWAVAMKLDDTYNKKKATGVKTLDSILVYPAQGLCPNGWHIPDTTEWNAFNEYLESYNLIHYEGIGAGATLKSVADGIVWNDYKENIVVISEDQYGFSAVSGGIYGTSGNFDFNHISVDFWTSTERDSTKADYRTVHSSAELHVYEKGGKGVARSIRCLKDQINARVEP